METTEHAARRIFGERAEQYVTSATHADPKGLAALARLVVDDAGAARALDIATGTGHTAFALAPHVARVIAVDLTPEMLAQARRVQAERGIANVVYGMADAHHLPFEDAAFDVVACRRAAHHFSDIHRALAEIRRVLRPGGRLALDDRSVPEDDFVDECMNALDRYHDESHVREYRLSAWRDMLAEHGLVVEKALPYTQHRPLTSLTDRVSPKNVARIHAVLAGLTPEQRAAFNLSDVDGQTYLNHWYVMIGARKDGTIA